MIIDLGFPLLSRVTPDCVGQIATVEAGMTPRGNAICVRMHFKHARRISLAHLPRHKGCSKGPRGN